MAREKLAQSIFVQLVPGNPPFLAAFTTLGKLGDGLEDGETVEVAEYRRVRFLRVKRGTVEVK